MHNFIPKVSLGRLECTRLLLDSAANVNTECDGWTVVQVQYNVCKLRSLVH